MGELQMQNPDEVLDMNSLMKDVQESMKNLKPKVSEVQSASKDEREK